MAPFNCPPGCYPPVTNTWELTNQWTGRSTLVHSSRLQSPQWSQGVWDNVMLHTGVPPYALDEFHRLSRGRDRVEQSTRKKSRSRSRGKNYDIDRIHKGEYKDHVPNRQDFTVKHVEKKPSQKELKSILKHKDGRICFDDVKGPYYEFNTFSEHPVVYDGFKFPTAEHLLLYFRFAEWPQIGHYLRGQPTVAKLWRAAEEFSDKKSIYWKQEKLFYMEVTLWHKFTQHKSLKKMILDTGERSITFISSVDRFWGAGRDGTGKNYMGKALEKTRWRIKTCTPPV
ncbi:DUF1768-domain-containing protein [Thelephora ganbajun]|uniref:DUF1768-domain-containing protein n=1 Tax=Thelephora ganbajun TaxID=370292 RepID=A0ACB6ZHI4_THEGA|nr:DUF1768-domain-containing protein [Thelephora ganbajun]